MGECHVHAALTPADIEARREEYPDAEFLVHPSAAAPRARCTTRPPTETWPPGPHPHRVDRADDGAGPHVTRRRFVVATETGVLHRLRRENPDKQFHALAESAECRFMKLITLEKLRDCLRTCAPKSSCPLTSRHERGAPSIGCWRLAEPLGLAEVRRALEEDQAREDVTTRLLGAAADEPWSRRSCGGSVRGRGPALVGRVYAELDRAACLDSVAPSREGAWVEPDAVLVRVRATAATLLAGERVALIFCSGFAGSRR